MVDAFLVPALLGVLFLAAVHANHQRFVHDRLSFWTVAAGTLAGITVLYGAGETYLDASTTAFGIVNLTGGSILLAAVAVPLSLFTLTRRNERATVE